MLKTETIKTKKYWTFTLVFWLIASLLMFLQGLRSSHWQQVIIRFLYFPIAGLLITSAKTLVYQSEPFQRLRQPVIVVVLMSALAAILTAVMLNPVTYLILNVDLSNRYFEMVYTGTIFFGILYLFWSFLYFQMEGRPLLWPSARVNQDYLNRISVDDGGQIRNLPIHDIECFTASGDYVEIHLGDKSYLKKETITELEALLDPDKFYRVHRSTIVNADKITAIVAKGSGAYDLTLTSGRVVSSSRSYRTIILDLTTEK